MKDAKEDQISKCEGGAQEEGACQELIIQLLKGFLRYWRQKGVARGKPLGYLQAPCQNSA